MSRIAPISEIAEINPSFPRDLNLGQESLVSFLPMAAVSENGRIIAQDERPMSEVSKGYTYFSVGDVLMAKITPCMENGKATYVQNLKHPAGFGSTEFHVLRPGSEVDGKYLFYMIWNPLFRKVAERNMTGTAGQKRVPSSFIKDFKIPLPPLPEQKRIAAILDKADSIRRKRKEAIRLTEVLLRSVFLDMFGDPVTNPKGWKVVTIRDMVSEVKYGTSAKASYEGQLSILRMNNITYSGDWDFTDLKRIDIPEKELSKYLVRKGDILFNRTNSKELVGKTAVYRRDDPMAYAGYLIRIRPNKQNNSEYIAAYLNSTHGKKILENMCKNIVGMANVNAQELQEICILAPPLKLQERYASLVNSLEKAKEKLDAALEVGNSLFNCLLQRAFIGELSK